MDRADTDGDNQLSETEFFKVYKRCLETEDAKKDFFGHLFLTKEEISRAEALFLKYDCDGSMSINCDELQVCEDASAAEWPCVSVEL